MDFWSFNIGHLITIVSFLGGGLIFIGSTKTQLSDLSKRAEALEKELIKLVEVLINQGRHEERLNAFDQRLCGQGRRIEELESRFNRDHGVRN